MSRTPLRRRTGRGAGFGSPLVVGTRQCGALRRHDGGVSACAALRARAGPTMAQFQPMSAPNCGRRLGADGRAFRPKSTPGSPAAAGACGGTRPRCSRRATPGGTRCWSPIPARARRWPGSCRRWPLSRPRGSAAAPPPEGLHTLYVSPLKALAHDVQRNLLTPVEEIGLPIRIETRSGDTPSDRKARQRARPPHVLLTTPEIAVAAAQLSRQRRSCSPG